MSAEFLQGHWPFADAHRHSARRCGGRPNIDGIARTQIAELQRLAVLIHVAGLVVHLDELSDLGGLFQKQLLFRNVHGRNDEELLPSVRATRCFAGLRRQRESATQKNRQRKHDKHGPKACFLPRVRLRPQIPTHTAAPRSDRDEKPYMQDKIQKRRPRQRKRSPPPEELPWECASAIATCWKSSSNRLHQ